MDASGETRVQGLARGYLITQTGGAREAPVWLNCSQTTMWSHLVNITAALSLCSGTQRQWLHWYYYQTGQSEGFEAVAVIAVCLQSAPSSIIMNENAVTGKCDVMLACICVSSGHSFTFIVDLSARWSSWEPHTSFKITVFLRLSQSHHLPALLPPQWYLVIPQSMFSEMLEV